MVRWKALYCVISIFLKGHLHQLFVYEHTHTARFFSSIVLFVNGNQSSLFYLFLASNNVKFVFAIFFCRWRICPRILTFKFALDPRCLIKLDLRQHIF